MFTTEAWVLYPWDGDPRSPQPAELRREPYSFPDLEDHEALVEPIYGSWEANMSHALARRPVDICRQRGDDKIVIGNSAVVRVLKLGRSVKGTEVGEICLTFGVHDTDEHGYMINCQGYDAPGTIGYLAKQLKVHGKYLVPIRKDTRFSYKQWGAYTVRYGTAWSNWRVAHGAYRLQVPPESHPVPFVWGWGGGTTLAELDLARRQGCHATMLSGNDKNIAFIQGLGIDVVDRRQFPHLQFNEKKYASDAEYKKAYQDSEDAFVAAVRSRTDNKGASIFAEYIGTPVVRATLRALAREGVLATAGWKHGMFLSTTRAVECISRHIHIHTHCCTKPELLAAMAYSEETGWMPPEPERTYAFDDIPQLADDFAKGTAGTYYPVFQVNAL